MNDNFTKLSELMQANPELTFNNYGYEKLSSEVMARNKAAVSEIEDVLRGCIRGFVRFQNFVTNPDGVRYQVHYNPEGSFTGVAYTTLEEFKDEGDNQ